MTKESNESNSAQDVDRLPSWETAHDPLEDGLRAVFENDEPTVETGEHRSVIQFLGETLGFKSQISLKEAQEGPSPVHRLPSHTAWLPLQVGKYRLAGEIARGGVGAVVRARDEDIGRDVALKVLLDEHHGDPQLTQRFVEEAQIGGQLQHPGIVPVHEIGLCADEKPFIAMKLVKGKTLSRLLHDREDPTEDRQRFLGIFEQICQPLAYAHAKGVIHRDLKPSNVMVGAFGEVQVMDWGLAKVLADGGAADDQLMTKAHRQISVIETVRSGSTGSESMAGSVVGTPAYMAPEQARGEVADVDERADVFGLGAILCEILTGEPPYTGESSVDIHRKARKGYLDDALSRLDASGADPQVVLLCKKCLSFEARNRPHDAGAVAQSISAYLESLEEKARTVQVQAAEAAARAETERRSRRLTLGLSIAILAALLVGGSAYSWENAKRREASHIIEMERQNTAMREESRFLQALARCEELAELAKEADELGEGGGKGDLWTSADEAIKNVERIKTLGIDPKDLESFESLRERVHEEIRKHEIITALDNIRQQASYPIIDLRYRDAFNGILNQEDYLDLPVAEVTAMVKQTGIAPRLALALDDWALVRKNLGFSWQKLADTSIATDTTPWRVRMWDAVKDGSPQALESFTTALIDNDKDVPTEFLCLLADSLMQDSETLDTAESLLRQAVFTDPESYRANYFLGKLLCDDRVGRYSEGVRFFMLVRAASRSHDLWLANRLSGYFWLAGDVNAALTRAAANVKNLGQHNQTAANALTMVSDPEFQPSPIVLRQLYNSIEDHVANNSSATRLWELLGATLARQYQQGSISLNGSLEEVLFPQGQLNRTLQESPYQLNALARVQFAMGRHADAVHSLEIATKLVNPSQRWLEQLARYRMAARSVVSYTSLDALLAGGNEVEIGDQWRYWKGTTSPSPSRGWTLPDYDDTQWPTGTSPFGYGHEDAGTLLSDMSGGYTSLYIRRAFFVPRSQDIARAILSISADDAFVAYLNGSRIGHARLNQDDVGHEIVASEGSTGEPSDKIEISEFLRSGENVLAIQGANKSLADDPFWLAPAVKIEYDRKSESMQRRIADCRKAIDDEKNRPIAKYLDGRELQYHGDYAGAETKFREVLAVDRTRAEPFRRLQECLVALHGAEKATALLREELAQGEHAPLIHLPPRKPGDLKVEFDGTNLLFTCSPFQHVDPNIPHMATMWEIREANHGSPQDLVVRIKRESNLESLELPAHRLRPNTKYRWRVSHWCNSGQSVTSDEAPFTTADFPQHIESFDLAELFNRDVILNPGDKEVHRVDGVNYAFTESGFDKTGTPNPTVRGVPHDRIIGIHRLGDYGKNNSIQVVHGEQHPIRIEVPRRKYLAIRFLVTGGWGDSDLPIRFEYTDGASDNHVIHCEDWLDSPNSEAWNWGDYSNEAVPILSELDHVHVDGSIRSGASLFEVSLTTRPDKKLIAIVLRAEDMQCGSSQTHFNLFAATGVSNDVATD